METNESSDINRYGTVNAVVWISTPPEFQHME